MRTLFMPVLFTALVACGSNEQTAQATAPEGKQLQSYTTPAGKQLLQETVVTDLDVPWDLAFIGPQQLLVTEKPGQLQRLDLVTGERTEITGVPKVIYKGQGGLLGLVLHPDFASNQLLYLSYAAAHDKGRSTRLIRARLENDALKDVKVLFTAGPAKDGGRHFGGALVFDDAGYLYLGVGDRGKRHEAQKLDSDLGKVHRFNADGSIPVDNPFVGVAGANDSIFSYGHRNPQGLALHPETGHIWEAEHGPRGGDEINRIQAGQNYGWPVITYGEEYRGGKIGEGTHKAGMLQPVHYYVPSMGTAGMAFYTGDAIPAWRNQLFVGGLVFTVAHVSRLALEGDEAVEVEPLFENLGMRIRNLTSGPDGRLYILSESGTIVAISQP